MLQSIKRATMPQSTVNQCSAIAPSIPSVPSKSTTNHHYQTITRNRDYMFKGWRFGRRLLFSCEPTFSPSRRHCGPWAWLWPHRRPFSAFLCRHLTHPAQSLLASQLTPCNVFSLYPQKTFADTSNSTALELLKSRLREKFRHFWKILSSPGLLYTCIQAIALIYMYQSRNHIS